MVKPSHAEAGGTTVMDVPHTSAQQSRNLIYKLSWSWALLSYGFYYKLFDLYIIYLVSCLVSYC